LSDTNADTDSATDADVNADVDVSIDQPGSRLVALGWDDRVASGFTEIPLEVVPGRVVRVERGLCLVALADGDHPARSATVTAVGDWVGVRLRGDGLVVEDVVPRWSQLARRDPQGRLQVLASNVDVVFIVAPADRLSAARVERETAMAWDSGAHPVVLLTKDDIAEPGLVERLRARLPGVDVLATSTVTGAGLDQVAARLRPVRTGVLLGPSGAGKSSLANALLGAQWLAVGDVRDGDRRGRHTTTVRQLLALPGGGVLIDTPGLRSLALAGEEGMAAAFADIEELAGECRFSDCRHEREPGCAIIAAVEAGRFDPDRLANYRKLRRELDYQERRDDPVARAEAERVWKIRAKASRQLNRDRGKRL
jgi:ribosome biogenesis GTPase